MGESESKPGGGPGGGPFESLKGKNPGGGGGGVEFQRSSDAIVNATQCRHAETSSESRVLRHTNEIIPR